MLNSLVGYGDEVAAERVNRVLGVRATRVEILRLIVASSEASAAELMSETGLTRNGVIGHLRILTEEGLLIERHATHPRGSGPITYWRADVDEVLSVLDVFSMHVMSSARM
jgi:DNA-binding transcriptional ArsR family regulator